MHSISLRRSSCGLFNRRSGLQCLKRARGYASEDEGGRGSSHRAIARFSNRERFDYVGTTGFAWRRPTSFVKRSRCGYERRVKLPNCGPILVVDDDADFRAYIVVLLSRAGFPATLEAGTGEEALAAARAERPALVLLDVFLPDINGFEICRTLRDEFGDDLPIIFVSGERVEASDKAVGMLVGGDDYLVKPVDPDEFLARVRRAIDRSQRERTDPSTIPRGHDLTKRELEVLGRLARGQTQMDIAGELVISPRTVASHVQRILSKLGVHSRAQAVAFAYQSGLLRGLTDGREAVAGSRGDGRNF